jgi:fluoroacetyl-CoA thioesterase
MQIGDEGQVRYRVRPEDLASSVAIDSQDEFPDVLATSKVVALLEISAARLMKPMLNDGQLSVGVSIEIKHFAPTPANEEVEAKATFLEMDGKLYKFAVEMSDKAGKVATGTHTRAIVKTAKLLEIALSRQENKSN